MVFCIAIIGYPYLSLSYPNLVGVGILEGAAVLTLLFVVLKFKAPPEKKHNYSSPKEKTKHQKPKKNPFF